MREAPEHRAHPIQRGVDGYEVSGRDVAARPRDAQRGGELAGRARSAAEQVSAVKSGALPRFADIEGDRFGGATRLVGERLAPLAEFDFQWCELFQHGK